MRLGARRSVLTACALRGHKYNLAYLIISHDLAVIRAMSHEIMVLKGGKVLERGDTETVIANPRHAYTRDLFKAAELT